MLDGLMLVSLVASFAAATFYVLLCRELARPAVPQEPTTLAAPPAAA